jgi:hypothetical protein
VSVRPSLPLGSHRLLCTITSIHGDRLGGRQRVRKPISLDGLHRSKRYDPSAFLLGMRTERKRNRVDDALEYQRGLVSR